MPPAKKSVQAAAPAPTVAPTPVPTPVPAPTKTSPGKGGKKPAAQPVAAAPAPAAPVAPVEKEPRNPVTHNMHKTLGVLCGLSNATDGVSRKEIQEKAGIKTTGYPKLIELGYAEENKVEGKRGALYRATAEGRKWFAANKNLYADKPAE